MTTITGKGEMIFSADERVHLRELGRGDWAAYRNREELIMCVDGQQVRGTLGEVMGQVMTYFAGLKKAKAA